MEYLLSEASRSIRVAQVSVPGGSAAGDGCCFRTAFAADGENASGAVGPAAGPRATIAGKGHCGRR